jgi:hypothetical protein
MSLRRCGRYHQQNFAVPGTLISPAIARGVEHLPA